jgi:hypothetical protein
VTSPDPERGPREWPRRLTAELLEFAERAMAQSQWGNPGALALAEGMITDLRIRRSQIACELCYGDLDAAGPAPDGACTCLARCTRPGCQADPDPVADLTALPETDEPPA